VICPDADASLAFGSRFAVIIHQQAVAMLGSLARASPLSEIATEPDR